MSKQLLRFGLVVGSVLICSAAFALEPSFDCLKARQAAEFAICGNAQLAELDNLVASGYRFIKATQGLAAADAIGVPFWKLRQSCSFNEVCIRQIQVTEINAFRAAGAPIALLGSLAGGAAPAAVPTSDWEEDQKQYLFYLSKKYPQALATWSRIVPQQFSAVSWIKNLDGTAGQTKLATLGNKRYFAGNVCMPHNCGDNKITYLISPDGSEAYGALNSSVLEANGLLFGYPSGQALNLLSYAVKDLENGTLFKRIPPEVTDPIAYVPQSGANPISSVPVQPKHGTFFVPVQINGVITLDFTVDSGASDVSIPADVVSTLMRTGSLQTTDFTGEQVFRLADGSTVPSATFIIRSLKVGDKTLENVKGSVSSAKGELLLGQSFLSRFSSWSIDNEKQLLLLR